MIAWGDNASRRVCRRHGERKRETVDLDQTRFAVLRPIGRIWVIGAVRGEADRLRAVHGEIAGLFQPGDRVVYLGDVMGTGSMVRGTIDELLRFRRWVLATPPFTHPGDVVVLRGSQEEMWRNLLQIQFAANPGEVLRWMAERGVVKTLEAYGGRLGEGIAAARDGPTALSQWTTPLRKAVRAAPGHGEFSTMLMRAAVTSDRGLLLVNAGLDPGRPLALQGDRFWWDGAGPDRMSGPYSEARMIVRGTDPERRGLVRETYWLGLDGGCGEGGPLHAACLTPDGTVLHEVVG